MFRRILSFLAVILFLGPAAFAQTTIKKLDHFQTPAVAQGAEGGLWRTDGNFESALIIKNVLEITPITVTPVLYMADGTEYVLSPVDLDASGVATVNINFALQAVPPNIQPHVSTYGSAAIRYSWSWVAAVIATVQTIDEVRSLTFHTSLKADINKVHVNPEAPTPQVLEGMWWKQEPNVGGFLTLLNTSMSSLAVTVELFDSQRKASLTRTAEIPSHNTVMLDLGQMLATLAPKNAAGGIRISYLGGRDALVVEGGLEDDAKGYSAPLVIAPSIWQSGGKPAPVAAPTTFNLGSAGLLIGEQEPMMQFPQGTRFEPYVVVRNTSKHSLTAQLAANYLRGPSPVEVPLGQIVLGPLATQQVDMKSLLAAAGIGKLNGIFNLSISYQGVGGELLAASGSVDQTLNYVFDVQPSIEAGSIGKIFCYWNVAGDTDTMLSLWNFTDQAGDFILTFYHRAGQYTLPVHLTAKNSTMISIASLIKSALPDAQGNIIPQDITEGSAKLTGGEGDFQHIYLATSMATYNTRTATCMEQCWNCNAAGMYVGGNTLLSINTSQQLTATLVLTTGGNTNVTTQSNWSIGNPSVATVGVSGLVTGKSLGTTIIGVVFPQDFPAPGYYCDYVPGAPTSCSGGGEPFAEAPVSVAVQITSADITIDTISLTLSAPTGSSGPLTLQVTGPGGLPPIDPIATASSYGPGSYTFSFQPSLIPIGLYKTITATWTVGGNSATATYLYQFKVLGTWTQTQYNTPAESSCSGSPLAITVWNSACQGTNTTVISGFDARVTNSLGGTGSGHSINWGDVLQEQYCSVGSGDLRGHATISGTLGPVNNSTVAACSTNADVYSSGAQVYIQGEGVKTVTDSCPACCKDGTHLDNYTTNTACSGIPSLPSALTVRLY